MRKFLVTGATGFLGRHLVERLLADKERRGDLTVRILTRRGTGWTGAGSVEVVEGDILDARAVDRAAAGVEGIFHLAGRVSRNPADAAALYDLHVRGTRNICEAARAQGRPRVVLASSSGTIAASRTPVLHTEDSPYVIELAGRWPYYLSKIYQEKIALAYYHDHHIPVVILNPSLLLGPGDERLSSTGDVLLFLQGHFLNIPGGGLNFVDARDTAAVMVKAMEKGGPGRRYLIGGHNMTIREFFALLERVSGVRGPRWELPESWSRGGATLLGWFYRMAGSRYPVEDETIEMGYRFWYCDSSQARHELGFSPRPAEETLRDTIAYLRRRPEALVP